jgi:hypothetical protein
MTVLRHIRRYAIPGLALGVLLAVCSDQALAQAPPAAAVPDTADNLTGTLLFIHGNPQRALPVPVADLRATCISRLEAGLRGKGHRTADRQVLENLMARWRIRGSHLVPREFLAELHENHDVGQVLVVTLLSDNARFLLTARMIDTRSGQLTFVELKDVDLPADWTDWPLVIDRISREICPPWTAPPVPTAAPLLVLPTRGIASDPEITSAAAHSLLKTLVSQGMIMIDPALVEVAMIRAGRPSHWLDAGGRRTLRDIFASEVILVSELVSYDPQNSSGVAQFFDGEDAGPGRRSLTVFSLTLRAVDLESGTAIRSAQIIHEKLPPTGWFGNRIQTTLLQELETTSLELWAAYGPEAEDD